MVTLTEFEQAQQRIHGVAVRTPLVSFRPSAAEDARHLWLKLESFQPIGSFKLRGAYNMIASLPEDQRRRGVITYSSGNHAQGVAYAAKVLGIPAVIVMPNNAPAVKVSATRALGAEVVFVGPASSERQLKAEQIQRERGMAMIPPYNDERIIAGAGTAAMEILADLPDVDVILSPVSGGGLLSGTATATKLLCPDVRVIGVEPELAADSQESFRKGKLVEWPAEKTTRTICDGLRTQSLGPINFDHIQKYVDDIVTVSDEQIKDAMRELALQARIVAEPSGACSVAALLYARNQLPAGKNYVAIVSGGNVVPELIAQVLVATS
ncbi:MAG: threonine/serine dehydratase [Acidobacteriales bacterium]|nr:threonine/serine dehydratase [Terriglobales bacterium]